MSPRSRALFCLHIDLSAGPIRRRVIDDSLSQSGSAGGRGQYAETKGGRGYTSDGFAVVDKEISLPPPPPPRSLCAQSHKHHGDIETDMSLLDERGISVTQAPKLPPREPPGGWSQSKKNIGQEVHQDISPADSDSAGDRRLASSS
ncbi:unnamed protein product [Pleuronectes platessa]|uniref:Uncharacterized protein n=1 Tax=Pleuronectes platessa TaxID=8262 RepID=A0A9N7VGF0_PLEPL|nr:unnamed protein product [Pleuronectes platessa]